MDALGPFIQVVRLYSSLIINYLKILSYLYVFFLFVILISEVFFHYIRKHIHCYPVCNLDNE